MLVFTGTRRVKSGNARQRIQSIEYRAIEIFDERARTVLFTDLREPRLRSVRKKSNKTANEEAREIFERELRNLKYFRRSGG